MKTTKSHEAAQQTKEPPGQCCTQEVTKSAAQMNEPFRGKVFSANKRLSEEEFAKLMNEKAKQLGAKNTHFSNVTGLHADTHYTTAEDMSIILSHAYFHLSIFCCNTVYFFAKLCCNLSSSY